MVVFEAENMVLFIPDVSNTFLPNRYLNDTDLVVDGGAADALSQQPLLPLVAIYGRSSIRRGNGNCLDSNQLAITSQSSRFNGGFGGCNFHASVSINADGWNRVNLWGVLAPAILSMLCRSSSSNSSDDDDGRDSGSQYTL